MNETEIEAFRADQKASKGLTAQHIAEAASLYDADKNPAPLVFGHPSNDSPALGIVSKARVEGSKLFLTMKDIAEDLKKAVRESRVINRSVAFWDPDHPSNPHPGKYSIRHLGFLGGQAPAIPGMGRLKFSADEEQIETDEEPAEAVVFAVEQPTPVKTVKEPKSGEKEPTTMEFTAEQKKDLEDRLAAAEAEANQLKADQEKRDREFAAAEATRRKGEDEAALTAAIEAGKVLPNEKDDLAKLFETLPTKALVFSAGELEPRQALTKFLDGLPKRGPAKGEPPVSKPGEFSVEDNKDRSEKALAEANYAISQAWKAPQPTQR